MEAKHFETEQALETCSRSEEDLLLERFKQEQEQLELARKHFDDMEFQQLEVIIILHNCRYNYFPHRVDLTVCKVFFFNVKTSVRFGGWEMPSGK